MMPAPIMTKSAAENSIAAPSDDRLGQALARVQACRLCVGELPQPPRPVLRVKPGTRILIIGQAPGTRAHASGLPFDDPSGERLRAWLGIGRETFYGHPGLSMMPMAFCFPGLDARGGDRPPPRRCAPAWHPVIRPLLPELSLTLLVGQYAQARYLAGQRRASLTATVAAWRDYGPALMPLPHPSWRNNRWLAMHPWFEAETLPALRARVSALLGG